MAHFSHLSHGMDQVGINSPPRYPPWVSDERLRRFWEIASRNMDRACRRWLRPQVAYYAEDMGPITLDDNAGPRVPSDGEDVPEFPDSALSALSSPPRTLMIPTATASALRAASPPKGRVGHQTPSLQTPPLRNKRKMRKMKNSPHAANSQRWPPPASLWQLTVICSTHSFCL